MTTQPSAMTARETQIVSSLTTSALVSIGLSLALAAVTHASAKAGFDLFKDASPFNAFLFVNLVFIVYRVCLSNARAANVAFQFWFGFYLLGPCVIATLHYYWNLFFPS